MHPIPLQVVDSFFSSVNLGDALIVGFVLGLLAVLPKRSRKLLTLHTLLFGLLFLVTPSSMFQAEDLSLLTDVIQYKMIGLVLVVVSPVLFATAED